MQFSMQFKKTCFSQKDLLSRYQAVIKYQAFIKIE